MIVQTTDDLLISLSKMDSSAAEALTEKTRDITYSPESSKRTAFLQRPSSPDRQAISPLIRASQAGDEEDKRLLMTDINVNETDGESNSALHCYLRLSPTATTKICRMKLGPGSHMVLPPDHSEFVQSVGDDNTFSCLSNIPTEVNTNYGHESQDFTAANHDECGTTVYIRIWNHDIYMVCDGRSSNKELGTVSTDNKDKFFEITPNLYAVAAGTVDLTDFVKDRVRFNKKKLRRMTVIQIQKFLLKWVKDGCSKLVGERRSSSKCSFLVGGFDFESNAPILFRITKSFTEPTKLSNHGGAGSGYDYAKLKKLKVPKDEEDENEFILWIRSIMVEPALNDKFTGGIMRVRKLSPIQNAIKLNVDLIYIGHIIRPYFESYEHYEKEDSKKCLFAICPTSVHQTDIVGYICSFTNQENLPLSHTLLWSERFGKKKQVRRLVWESEIAADVYSSIEERRSTIKETINGMNFLKVACCCPLRLTGAHDCGEIIIMRPSKEALNLFMHEVDCFKFLPPEERDNYS